MSKLNRVLVVDDDPIIAKSFERSLPKTEYVVVTASSGDEALEKLKEGTYDVVFTDIKMPGMSGLELTQKIKAKQSWTPVVIITGFGSEENQATAKELGVVDFIQKPLNPAIINDTAHKAIEQPVVSAPAWGITEPVIQQQETRSPRNVAKEIGLFFAAPFIGLAYVVFMPVVGLGIMVSLTAKQLGVGTKFLLKKI